MLTEIGEKVNVGAVFGPGQGIIPKWFIWDGRRHLVDRVTFVWRVRDGQSVFHHFAVTAGPNLYELTYHVGALEWMLTNVSSA